MASFEAKLRKGKVAQPQQHSYSREKWDEALRGIERPTNDDVALHNTGIWFSQKLEALRGALKEARDDEISNVVRIKAMVGAINRSYVAVNERSRNKIERMVRRDKKFLWDKAMRLRHASSASPVSYLPDEIITGIIDYAPLVIDRALTAGRDSQESSDNLLGRLLYSQQIGNLYHMYSDLWLQCLWRGWRVKIMRDKDVLTPIRIVEAKQEAVRQYRHQTWVEADTTAAISFWRSDLDDEARSTFLHGRTIVRIERHKGRKRRFVVGRIRTTSDALPPRIVLAMMRFDAYLQDILDDELPQAPGISIRQLLKILSVLHDVGLLLLEEVGANTAVQRVERLLEFCLTIHAEELCEILRDTLGLEPERAQSAIDFLSYAPRVPGGLWAHPLVSVPRGFSVVLPPIIVGNLTRIVEFWIRKGGLAVDRLGLAFEKQVRSEVSVALRQSSRLKDVAIHSEPLTLGSEGEEIDLLFRIGKTIVVAEVKCNVFPADPIEVHNYVQEDLEQKAVEQITRKMTVVRREIDTVAHILGLKISDRSVRVVPIILTNQALGSGFSIKEIPSLDLRYLCRYLEFGTAQVMATRDPATGAISAEEVALYTSPEDAEENCARHFADQPIISLFAQHTRPQLRPIPTADGRAAFYAYFETDLTELVSQMAEWLG